MSWAFRQTVGGREQTRSSGFNSSPFRNIYSKYLNSTTSHPSTIVDDVPSLPSERSMRTQKSGWSTKSELTRYGRRRYINWMQPARREASSQSRTRSDPMCYASLATLMKVERVSVRMISVVSPHEPHLLQLAWSRPLGGEVVEVDDAGDGEPALVVKALGVPGVEEGEDEVWQGAG
uniref:Uncharacterized protein n=1 Tax=Ananas comosus var. bracteatus TaxID=296719 RepID=A0A6V7PRN9_ANACO|nr:unnamed protein product [Ananas comosus var. bracteatus]